MAAEVKTGNVSTAQHGSVSGVAPSGHVLVVAAGQSLCAIPIEHVRETMRALPVEAVANVPKHVLGLAVIRGKPAPVVDLHELLAGQTTAIADKRFVTLALENERTVALAVDQVVGVRKLDTVRLEKLPPLLETASVIEAVGSSDQKLLVVFYASRVIPDAAWAALEAGRT